MNFNIFLLITNIIIHWFLTVNWPSVLGYCLPFLITAGLSLLVNWIMFIRKTNIRIKENAAKAKSDKEKLKKEFDHSEEQLNKKLETERTNNFYVAIAVENYKNNNKWADDIGMFCSNLSDMQDKFAQPTDGGKTLLSAKEYKNWITDLRELIKKINQSYMTILDFYKFTISKDDYKTCKSKFEEDIHKVGDDTFLVERIFESGLYNREKDYKEKIDHVESDMEQFKQTLIYTARIIYK